MNRHHQTLQLLSRARPGRLDPGPDSTDLDAITAYPGEDHARPATRRATRRRLLLTAGLVPTMAMGALAVAAVLVRPDATPPADPGRAAGPPAGPGRGAAPQPATAQQFLLSAAERITGEEATTGRYWVTAGEQGEVRRMGQGAGAYDVTLRSGSESWQATRPGDRTWFFTQHLGATPTTDADAAAWQRAGSPDRWMVPPPEGAPKGTQPKAITAAPGPRQVRTPGGRELPTDFLVGGLPMSAAELATLPADPAALRAHLLERYTDSGSESRNEYLFWSAEALVLNLPASGPVRAAAYRMMAGLDGVTTLGTVTDKRGRAGVAVARTRRGDGGNLGQIRLIIDPETGRALAEESWSLGGDAPAGGKLLSYQVVTRADWTDETPPAA